MKVSLVLVSKNEERYVRRFFESLGKQTRKPDEIILVDSSYDRTPEIARPYVDKLIRIKPSTAGAAREIGVKKSRGDIIVFTDLDAVLHKYWLENLTKMFDDSNVNVVQGTILWKEIRRDVPLKGKRVNHCNTAYRRKVLEEFHFDPLMIWDDIDMSYRFSKKYPVYGCPKAIVNHYGSTDDFWSTSKRYGRGWARLFFKYKSPYWIFRALYNSFYNLYELNFDWFFKSFFGLIYGFWFEFSLRLKK